MVQGRVRWTDVCSLGERRTPGSRERDCRLTKCGWPLELTCQLWGMGPLRLLFRKFSVRRLAIEFWYPQDPGSVPCAGQHF